MDPRALRKSRVNFSIHLHPSLANRALDGIHEQLNARLRRFSIAIDSANSEAHLRDSLLRRWNEDMDGVLLSYTDERIDSHQAVIDPYFPYLRLNVTANVVLFVPEPGFHMCGTVNKIGADYVGMVVLGAFNAAIGRQNIRPDLQYSAVGNHWEHKRDARHRIEPGCEIMFRVHSVERDPDHFSMTGSLWEPWTGLVMAASAALELAVPENGIWNFWEGYCDAGPAEGAAAMPENEVAIGASSEPRGAARVTLDEPQPVQKRKKKKRRKEDKDTAAQSVPHDGVTRQAPRTSSFEGEEEVAAPVAQRMSHDGAVLQELGPSKVAEEEEPAKRHKTLRLDPAQLPNGGLPNGHAKEEKKEKKRRRREGEAVEALASSAREAAATVNDLMPAEIEAEEKSKVKKKHKHKEGRRDKSVHEKT